MAENLIVVGRLGVVGAEPLGLYDELTQHFDADQHVPADIAAEIIPEGHERDRAAAAAIDQEMLSRTEDSLAAGTSVIFDAFVNKPEKRQTLVELAQAAGALAILVHPRTRMSVVRSRIEERYRNDQLYFPSSATTLSDELRIAGQMMTYLQKDAIHPDRNRVPHFCFDGTQTNQQTIRQLDAYVKHLSTT